MTLFHFVLNWLNEKRFPTFFPNKDKDAQLGGWKVNISDLYCVSQAQLFGAKLVAYIFTANLLESCLSERSYFYLSG